MTLSRLGKIHHLNRRRPSGSSDSAADQPPFRGRKRRRLTLRIGIRQYRRGAQARVFVARTQTSVRAEECELVHILARLTGETISARTSELREPRLEEETSYEHC